PHLIRLSKHLEELGLNSANLTVKDLNLFFEPPQAHPDGDSRYSQTPWVRPFLRYLDLTKNPYLTQAALFNPKVCLLATPESSPLGVLEFSEKIIAPMRQRSQTTKNRTAWVVRELGRRYWYVRVPPTDQKDPV